MTALGAGGKTGFAAPAAGSEPPLARRERAALLAERDDRRAGPPTLRTGDGRPDRTGTRHRRRTAIPGKGPPPPGCRFSVGEPAGPKPDGPTALAATPALSRGK